MTGEVSMSATAGRGLTPTQVGRYRLCTELGRGGMGVVHLAVDESGRAVAVKILREQLLDDPATRARLAREVEHLSRIRHPGVAGIIDADVRGDRPYVVTRYVRGPSLERFVAEHGPLRPPQLLSLGQDLSEAIGAAHAAGVVHRDIKPANVLLHDGRPVLIDFGIAHSIGDSRLTSTGLVMGTPGFLAPEILDGAVVTPATDWWAWAATLTFAASGRVPFGEGPVGAVLARIRAGECDLAGVDPTLAPLLCSALAPDPRARPDQRRILSELARYAEGGPATAVLPVMPITQSLPEVRPEVAAPGSAPASLAAGPARSAPLPSGPGLAPGSEVGPSAYGPAAAPGWAPANAAAGIGPHSVAPWQQVPGAQGPGRRRRTGLVLSLAALLAGVALVAPGWALVVGALLSFVARTVDRAVGGLALRRQEYGARRGDVAGAVLRSPAYAVGAALAAFGGSLLPALAGAGGVLGGIGLQTAGVLPGSSLDTSASGPLLMGACAALVVGWWGPGAGAVRRGTRVLLRGVSPGRYGRLVAACLLIGVAAVLGLVAQSTGFTPSWVPFGEDPLSWARVVHTWG